METTAELVVDVAASGTTSTTTATQTALNTQNAVMDGTAATQYHQRESTRSSLTVVVGTRPS
jgi:hypothetical protein